MVAASNQSEHKEQQLMQVITLLSDGEYHSGQKIADELAVSRAYIWKLIQQLQEYGLELESVSGKGYVWQTPSDLLHDKAFQLALTDLNISYQYYLTTNSTNQKLKEKFNDKSLVVAEYQIAGRGRRGRSWSSPMATNLYFSYGWRTDLPVQQLGGLSLIVGISIVEALQQMGFDGMQLKWPNDVRVQQKKLAGILVELTGDAAGDLEVIIGIGLNVNMQTEQNQIEQEWTSLAKLHGNAQSRQKMLLALLKQLQINLDKFEQDGFGSFQKTWNQYDESFNQMVEIIRAKDSLYGIAKGVDQSGALLLERDGTVETVYAGEVSLRVGATR